MRARPTRVDGRASFFAGGINHQNGCRLPTIAGAHQGRKGGGGSDDSAAVSVARSPAGGRRPAAGSSGVIGFATTASMTGPSDRRLGRAGAGRQQDDARHVAAGRAALVAEAGIEVVAVAIVGAAVEDDRAGHHARQRALRPSCGDSATGRRPDRSTIFETTTRVMFDLPMTSTATRLTRRRSPASTRARQSQAAGIRFEIPVRHDLENRSQRTQ